VSVNRDGKRGGMGDHPGRGAGEGPVPPAGRPSGADFSSRGSSAPVWLATGAALLFWSSVFGFAAVREAYSHATDAVSELGVWGAPNMWGFNILGYALPGALLGAACWIVARRVRPKAWILPAMMTWAGLAITLAGLSPGDLSRPGNAWTVAHLIGSISGILVWLPGAAWLGIAGLRGQRVLSAVCFVGLVLMIGAFSLYALMLPGIVQRICFAVLFGWGIAAALASRVR
jgi:hypothetical protein